MMRVGGAINLLLDGLVQDRAQSRRLASLVISAQDEERARIARELHDSSAQTLTALLLQVSAAARDEKDPVLATRLEEIRVIAGSALEEVRVLSHTVHPRVLDDLGLVAALEWLVAAHARGVGRGDRGQRTRRLGAVHGAQRRGERAVPRRAGSADERGAPREAASW